MKNRWGTAVRQVLAGHASLLLAACSDPDAIVVPEPEATPMSGIAIDGFSFSFPVGFEFEGAVQECFRRASGCMLADDSTHLVWRGGDLRFDYVPDRYAEVPPRKDWGEAITINGRPAFRTKLDDGGTRYLVTNHHGGPDTAVVSIWKEPEQPLFWGTCRTEADCDVVLQTIASITFRSVEGQCEIFYPQEPEKWNPPPDYRPRPVPFPTPVASRPDPIEARQSAPPPPTEPVPAKAPEICRKFVDVTSTPRQ